MLNNLTCSHRATQQRIPAKSVLVAHTLKCSVEAYWGDGLCLFLVSALITVIILMFLNGVIMYWYLNVTQSTIFKGMQNLFGYINYVISLSFASSFISVCSVVCGSDSFCHGLCTIDLFKLHLSLLFRGGVNKLTHIRMMFLIFNNSELIKSLHVLNTVMGSHSDGTAQPQDWHDQELVFNEGKHFSVFYYLHN